jgi:hypothetical protein
MKTAKDWPASGGSSDSERIETPARMDQLLLILWGMDKSRQSSQECDSSILKPDHSSNTSPTERRALDGSGHRLVLAIARQNAMKPMYE